MDTLAEAAAPETSEELYARLSLNASTLEKAVITVILDPWTYLLYFAIFMTPLLFAAFWASSVLLKEEHRERRKEKRRQERKKASIKAKSKAKSNSKSKRKA